MELFKDIPNYEGLYYASSNGRIFSYYKEWFSGRKGTTKKSTPEKEVAYEISKHGYIRVKLKSKHGVKFKSVHRLISETFLEPVPGKTVVNHIDGNKKNNSSSNLEWVTHKENSKHAKEIGLILTGGRHPRARKVICRETKKIFATVREAAKQSGLPITTLKQYLDGTSPNKTTLEYL